MKTANSRKIYTELTNYLFLFFMLCYNYTILQRRNTIIKGVFAMNKETVNAIVEKLKGLVAKGNVNRIVIRSKQGREILNISVNVGVVGGVVMLSAAKWVLIIGALTSVCAGCTVEVVKNDNEVINVVSAEDGEKLRHAFSNVADKVADAVDGLGVEINVKKDDTIDADVIDIKDEEDK